MKQYLYIITLATYTLFHQSDTLAASAAPYIRYEAHTPQGQKALFSMQKGMDKIKALGCSKAVSWYYQSAIHGAPNPNVEGDLVTNPLCPWFTSNAKSSPKWSKCASHDRSGPPSDIHFLPWHRLYIGHFEKIIRKYSGDPSFALPYWDYDKYPTLPTRLQQRFKNSLSEPARESTLNQGKPMTNGARAIIRQDSIALQDIVDYPTYNSQINKGLHDFVHDYIGGTGVSYNQVYNQNISAGLMGNVASAAFDAVFWLHHANVDRLWQDWIIKNRNQKRPR